MSTNHTPAHNQKKTEQDATSEGTLSFTFDKFHAIAAVTVIAVIAAVFLLRRTPLAATVNGQPIDRATVTQRLEKEGGKKVLDSIITETLIKQEAAKRKITVSAKDINDRMATIKKSVESQGQSFAQALKDQGMTEQDLRDQLQIQMVLEKIVAKDIQVTDKEVEQFIEAQKSSIPENVKPEDVKKAATEQVRQQKLSQKIQEFVQDIKSKAKINYLVNY